MLTKGTAPNAVLTAFDALVKEEFDYQRAPDRATARDATIFKQTTIDRSAVIIEQRSGTGYLQLKNEQQDAGNGTVRVGNQVVYTVLERSKNVPISRTFKEDDQHAVVTKTIQDEGRLLRLTQDREALSMYGNGFGTTDTNDGVDLFSNSHTTLNSITVDNKETGVLNGTNLNTMLISLSRQKTQDGTIGGYEPEFLLVPQTLVKTAHEVLDSSLRPGTANNDVNYYDTVYGSMQIKASPFLDDITTTGTTAYFVGSRNHSMTRWVREAFYSAMVGWEIQSNNDFVYKYGYREVVGCPDFGGLIGSDGSV